MLTLRKGTVVEVNIHGMTELEARRQLELLLNRVDKSTTELVVIHGYHHGQALKEMIWSKFIHPKISCKLPSLNEGKTRLLLK